MSQTTPIAPLPPEIARGMPYLLHRCAAESARMVSLELAPLGIEVKHFGVLCALHHHGAKAQGWLGDNLGIDRTTMVALVDELEQRGFVERLRDPLDRRRYAVTITPEGVDVWTRARASIDECERRLLEPLEGFERDLLRDTLGRLAQACDGPRPAEPADAAAEPVSG